MPSPHVSAPTLPPAASWARLLGRLLASDQLILWLGLVYFAVMAPFTPGLASGSNLRTLLSYALPILVVSVGLTPVLILGGIDLSVTSIIALASVAGGMLMSAEGGWLGGSPWAAPLGFLTMLLVGAALGAVNGAAVTWGRIPAFIATLTSMMFVSGLAIWLTLSKKIGGLPEGFVALGRPLGWAPVLALLATAAAHLALTRTLYGKWLYAIGFNARASRISGVPVAQVTFGTYVFCGWMAGLSSVLFTASLETGNPEMARDNLLDVVGAVVIGGTSLYGGRGRILGTVFGVFFFALVDNSLNLRGLSFYTITMVKGGIILAAALLDTARVRSGAA